MQSSPECYPRQYKVGNIAQACNVINKESSVWKNDQRMSSNNVDKCRKKIPPANVSSSYPQVRFPLTTSSSQSVFLTNRQAQGYDEGYIQRMRDEQDLARSRYHKRRTYDASDCTALSRNNYHPISPARKNQKRYESYSTNNMVNFSPIQAETEQMGFDEDTVSNQIPANLGEIVDEFLREIGMDEIATDQALSSDNAYKLFDEEAELEDVDRQLILEKFDEWMASS